MKIQTLAITGVLLILCLIVTIDYIYIQQQSRKEFIQLQKLIKQEHMMNAEFGRMQIQFSSYVNNSRIEKKAKNELGMKLPQKEQIINIKR